MLLCRVDLCWVALKTMTDPNENVSEAEEEDEDDEDDDSGYDSNSWDDSSPCVGRCVMFPALYGTLKLLLIVTAA
jgi:hypothetical protein